MFPMARFFGAAGRILVLALVFLLIFASTGLLIALMFAWIQGTHITDETNLIVGMLCGLIGWLFIAVFHLRRETVHLSFLDRCSFLEQVQKGLGEMGYELKTQSASCLGFKPSFRAFLPGGRIQVHIEHQAATVTGPKVCVEWLRQRMRIRNQLDNVHQAMQDDRRRHGERLLKRVNLSLRFTPEQWPEIKQHIVQTLARQGEVVCELHILAQSEGGIPENTVEFQVRPWLLSQGIAVEIHKEPLQQQRKTDSMIQLPTMSSLSDNGKNLTVAN